MLGIKCGISGIHSQAVELLPVMKGGRRMTVEKTNLLDRFERLPAADYAVRLVAKMNNYDLRIVRFKGDFVWHRHPETDETFIVLDGTLVMNLRDGRVEVGAGEMIVIPKGVEHRPSSEDGYKALLIEPEGVPNTGDVRSEITIEEVEWV